MHIRRQLTVASPLTAAQIMGAARDAIAGRDLRASVRASLAGIFEAENVLLTDSGTSALVLALQMFARPLAPIAMPAYACVDLIAAARRANVRVRFFDVDPQTLSPDMDSLQRVLEEGVSAVVVAHLYGFPADMPAVVKVAHDAGVPVIEDAAQHASATIAGRPAGSFGDVTVLSFGRGKGTTSGRGGALTRRRTSDAWRFRCTNGTTMLTRYGRAIDSRRELAARPPVDIRNPRLDPRAAPWRNRVP